MLTYDDMRAWCRWHELVINRLKVLYWVTGELGTVTNRGIRYRVTWRDNIIAEYSAYDVDSVRTAYERVDAVEHFAWEVRRQGLAWC